LKCFSEKEPLRDTGPYRFSHDMIKKYLKTVVSKYKALEKPYIRAP
jgi:hypothetical protein